MTNLLTTYPQYNLHTGMPDPRQIQVSVVSPVYRSEKLVRPLVKRLASVLEPMNINYEIILVDDGSPDESWERIVEECRCNLQLRGVQLSRNFGQHYAISAGLSHVRGEWIVVMDCDLQDQPEEIPKLLSKAREGYDIVLARRAQRQDGLFKRLGSAVFYGLLGYLTGSRQDAAIANFGIYHANVIASINAMTENIRYFPTMVKWVGFRSIAIDVSHAPRPEGSTSYNWSRLVNLAIDIILAYSDKPLKLVVKIGILVSMSGFVFAGYTALRALKGEIAVLGYASVIVSIWVLAGLIIFINGVIGLYVGKVFEGVKRRPAYIVAQVVHHE